MLIKCKARFAENINTQFGFYGPEGQAQRRIKNNEEFMFDFDEKKHKIVERGGESYIGSWIQVLDKPKKKPGPKKVETLSVDN